MPSNRRCRESSCVLGLAALADVSGPAAPSAPVTTTGALALFAIREVTGGVALGLGLEVFAVQSWSDVLIPAIPSIPICLLAGFVSVGIPVAAMKA